MRRKTKTGGRRRVVAEATETRGNINIEIIR